MNVNTLKVSDEHFPGSLKLIAGSPPQLYWSGAHPRQWQNKPKVAIVGSRKFSSYGKSVAAKLSHELAEAGVVIISGLAYGIDITAHRSALEAGGTTVAVLGTGLDSIYPAAHMNVARQITQKGTIITEYAPNTPGFPSNFIYRNRIISGLADVVVIPEAALKSGSLHTARFAMEQGKTVMAVPGNITAPTSEGCNNLIKSGAVPITNSGDIFFALKMNPQKQQSLKIFRGTELEELIYRLIERGISDQELLVAAARTDGPTLSSALTMLEINGFIRAAGGGNWAIT